MAIKFEDLLKKVENAGKTGYKKGKGWFPHESVEGGTRTIAYGHKLSEEEDQGNYVTLPDGTTVDLNERGLTEEEAQLLLENDISRAKAKALIEWDRYRDVPFSSLDPLYQNVLTEIVFNIGTLRNRSTGKFGWPSLAEGIKNRDKDVIKKEIMRFFTNKEGERVPLTERVNKIREYIDNPDFSTASVEEQSTAPAVQEESPVAAQQEEQTAPLATPQQETPSAPPVLDPAAFLSSLVTLVQQQIQQPQSGSQEPEQQVVEEKTEQTEEPQEEAQEQPAENRIESLLNRAADSLGRNRGEDEARLRRTYNEARLEEMARQAERGGANVPTRTLEDKLANADIKWEVIESKVFNRTYDYEEEPVETTEGVVDDSKDPIYGLF